MLLLRRRRRHRVPAVAHLPRHVFPVKLDADAGSRVEVQHIFVLVRRHFTFALVRLVRLLGELEHGLVLRLPLVNPGLRLAGLDVVAVFVAAVRGAAAAAMVVNREPILQV